MGFTSNETNTGSATGDKLQKQDTQHPNFGQRIGDYAKSRTPMGGRLFDQVFGTGGQNMQKDTQGIQYNQAEAPQLAPMPDGSQGLDQHDMLSEPKAKGLNFSAIAKLLMGA